MSIAQSAMPMHCQNIGLATERFHLFYSLALLSLCLHWPHSLFSGERHALIPCTQCERHLSHYSTAMPGTAATSSSMQSKLTSLIHGDMHPHRGVGPSPTSSASGSFLNPSSFPTSSIGTIGKAAAAMHWPTALNVSSAV